MFKQSYISILLLLLFPVFSFAQGEGNWWLFGEGVMLNFSPTPQVYTKSAMETDYGGTSFSDPHGNLLFYTNGITVWTKDHMVMENGLEINGNEQFLGNDPLSQAIVPYPDEKNKYYVFINSIEQHGPANLDFALVDMSYNHGQGKVIEKDIFTGKTTAEQLGLAHHANGMDYWVSIILFKEIHTYRISENGVATEPVVSLLPAHYPNYTTASYSDTRFYSHYGSMKFSPDMTHMALSSFDGSGISDDNIYFFGFDNATGEFSFKWSFQLGADFPYGLEFSESGELLYLSALYGTEGLWQLQLNGDSKPQEGSVISLPSPPQPSDLKRAPDGNIYILSSHRSKLSLIEKPEIIGSGCQVKIDCVDLLGKKAALSFPKFISPPQKKLMFSVVGNCVSTPIGFAYTTTAVMLNQRWYFGDGQSSTESNPTHTYSTAGDYTVKLTVTYADTTTETIEKQITIHAKPKTSAIQF